MAPAATRDHTSKPVPKMMISCTLRPCDQYPIAPSARYATDMTGVEADTAEVNLPGCRMEFMISTYANWPPYLDIHRIHKRKERTTSRNLYTVA